MIAKHQVRWKSCVWSTLTSAPDELLLSLLCEGLRSLDFLPASLLALPMDFVLECLRDLKLLPCCPLDPTSLTSAPVGLLVSPMMTTTRCELVQEAASVHRVQPFSHTTIVRLPPANNTTDRLVMTSPQLQEDSIRASRVFHQRHVGGHVWHHCPEIVQKAQRSKGRYYSCGEDRCCRTALPRQVMQNNCGGQAAQQQS